MTPCNTLNLKFSSSQHDKLKSRITNGTEVILNLSSNSDDEINFAYKLLLTEFIKFQWFVKLLQLVHQLT